MISLGGDGADTERTYAMEWDGGKASFFIDGKDAYIYILHTIYLCVCIFSYRYIYA